jgi:predicted O-linked N-acetylglucosamine transferase (SPINDLY family)
MSELIAASRADYVVKALVLAADRTLKSRVAEAVRRSTLFDPVAFARSLETVYAALVRR